MVATVATAAFLSVPPSSSDLNAQNNLGGTKTTTGRLQVKTNAQAPRRINGLSTSKDGVKSEGGITSSSHPRTFINQLPDWSMFLAAITTIFLAAEKQWTTLDWKPKRPDMLVDPFGLGRIMEDGCVFSQNFSIRSYEIGADKTASIGTLMNHLQETALNHVKTAGLLGDGFGSTPEMCKKNLIWVVTRMNVLVDRYPTWGDNIQVNSWVSSSGKNGMRRDWHILDCKTGETLTRASSVWVLMNKETRKLSKMPDEVRSEIGPYFVDVPPIIDEDDGRKLPKLDDNTAEYIQSGLKPRWSDLDVNQHVNNVKYIAWILESVPLPLVESHELTGMSLEYRRECSKDSTLQSLATISGAHIGGLQDSGHVECQHLLRLEEGPEVLRARTKWQPKHASEFGKLSQDWPNSG